MTKTRIMVAVCFVLAFAAGAAAGLLVRRGPPRGGRPGSWLARELKLTEKQNEQMRQIWSEAMGKMRQQSEALRKERDDAVQALLSEEQKSKYKEVMQSYQRKTEELAQERRKVFQEAEKRTESILTDSQRKVYEEMLKRRAEAASHHRDERPPPEGGPRRGGPPRGGLPEGGPPEGPMEDR